MAKTQLTLISKTENILRNFPSNSFCFFFETFKASDSQSKIHLKCGDTDEVRPSDYTRFSQVDKIYTTNYLYELNSTTTQIPPVFSSIPLTKSESILKNTTTTKFNNVEATKVSTFVKR